jgi:hypothetical protein
MELHFNGRLQALPENIRIWWKIMAAEKDLAYNNTETFTAVKSLLFSRGCIHNS